MERAIIHSDLKKQEIQPQYLLDNYLDLLSKDIKKIMPKDSLQDTSCPVTGEIEVKNSFPKMGMQPRQLFIPEVILTPKTQFKE